MGGALARRLLMALGALSALFALLAIFDQAWELVYAWLGVGLVAETLTQVSWTADPAMTADPTPPGERRVVGALSYLGTVFIPIVAMLHAGFLDGTIGVLCAGAVIVSSLLRLAHRNWAAPVQEFEGLPAAWGVVGFTLYALDATPGVSELTIGFVVIVGLLPVTWPHPFQSRHMRQLTRAVSWVWIMAAAATLWHGFPAFGQAKFALIATGIYGIILSAIQMRTHDGGNDKSHLLAALDANEDPADFDPR